MGSLLEMTASPIISRWGRREEGVVKGGGIGWRLGGGTHGGGWAGWRIGGRRIGWG